MANEKLTLLKHLQLTAARCSAMVTSKISELTAAVSQDLEELDDAKQDKLTFDTKPTSGSTNPVTSGGVYAAIPTKTSELTNDSGFKTTDTTYENATHSVAGLMSAADKSKLDGIAASANAYIHPTYTARTGVPTTDQTPAFGGTFTVTQPASDATGHIIAMNSKTITIPSSAATTSAAGLMSAADKSKLDGIATGANKFVLPYRLSGAQASGSGSLNDPNNGVETGFYYVKGTTNRPPFSQNSNDDYRILVTAYGNNWLQQIATDFRCDDIFYRRLENNVWKPWVKIYPTPDVTTSAAGLMSASDKSKLDGITAGATKVTVDSALSSSSTNPVQNKVIHTALASKQDKLTFDTTPTTGSSNPVTSDGVAKAIGGINSILDEINGEVV